MPKAWPGMTKTQIRKIFITPKSTGAIGALTITLPTLEKLRVVGLHQGPGPKIRGNSKGENMNVLFGYMAFCAHIHDCKMHFSKESY